MSGTRKRPGSEDAGAAAAVDEAATEEEEESVIGGVGKRRKTVEMTDEDYYLEEFLCEFENEEKEAAMKLLEKEISNPNITKYSSSSSYFVLINQESCGSLISNDSSSVMASIQFSGWPLPDLSLPATDLANVVMKNEENIKNFSADVDIDLETDEEWIENVLSEISFEF